MHVLVVVLLFRLVQLAFFQRQIQNNVLYLQQIFNNKLKLEIDTQRRFRDITALHACWTGLCPKHLSS